MMMAPWKLSTATELVNGCPLHSENEGFLENMKCINQCWTIWKAEVKIIGGISVRKEIILCEFVLTSLSFQILLFSTPHFGEIPSTTENICNKNTIVSLLSLPPPLQFWNSAKIEFHT